LHEIRDEEAARTVQDIEDRAPMIEDEIPFGVRALQGGIEIDGVWHVRGGGQQAIPEELKRFREENRSSGESENESISTKSSHRALSISPSNGESASTGHDIQPTLELLLPPNIFVSSNPSRGRISSQSLEGEFPLHPNHIMNSNRKTDYKPRYSSQLRFSSRGEYHEDALSRLEGITKRSASELPPSHSANSSLEVIIPENERTSSSSTGIRPVKQPINENNAEIDTQPLGQATDINRKDSAHQSGIVSSTSVTRDPVDRYLPVTHKSPHRGSTDLFKTSAGPSIAQTDENLATRPRTPESEQSLNCVRWPLISPSSELSSSRVTILPSFKGPLHANKVVRKVNSGFEILPAGTFGIPVAPVDSPNDRNASPENRVKRGGKKLQRKETARFH
jgi:hypothetical protein